MANECHMCPGWVLVTRQPVFNRQLQPWGTAVGFVQPPGAGPVFCDDLTTSILLEGHLPQRGPATQTIVSFDVAALLDRIPRMLPPAGMVVEVEEAAGDSTGISEIAAELKQLGYRIAVSGFRNRVTCRAMNSLADVLIIDSSECGFGGALQELILSARHYGVKVQVRGLSCWNDMLQARAANADMLQGFFFNQMNLPPSGKSVTATQLSRLRLLACLDKPDADFMELAQIVEADAALTYRLLVFLNSASFGMRRKVDSIKQAIVLAGWAPLNKWLKFILIADLSPSPRHQELCYYAAQRADFLKRVAKTAGLERLVPTLSLLGLLSYIEAILEMPPAQALASVPVADVILHALCGKRSPLSPWLALVQAMENAEWDHAEQIGKSAKLSMAELARCYRESFAVADALFRYLPASQAAPA